MAAKKKPQLPKSVLDMKFMRRTKERLEKEQENLHDHDKLYSNAITNEMRHASDNVYIAESSILFCEELLEGRLSFKGMNPEIEKLMAAENKTDDIKGEMIKDVSDEILAKKMNRFNNRKRHVQNPSDYNLVKRKK